MEMKTVQGFQESFYFKQPQLEIWRHLLRSAWKASEIAKYKVTINPYFILSKLGMDYSGQF